MIDPDRDEKLCEAVTPGELHGVSLASARGGILWCMFLGYPMNYDQQIASFALERDAVYFKEARTLLPEYIAAYKNLVVENHDLKTDIDALRDWQRGAVGWLEGIIKDSEYLPNKEANRNYQAIKQLIEEAK